MKHLLTLLALSLATYVNAQTSITSRSINEKTVTVVYDDTIGATVDTILINVSNGLAATYYRLVCFVDSGEVGAVPDISIFMDQAACSDCPWTVAEQWDIDTDNNVAAFDENGESINSGMFNLLSDSVADSFENNGFPSFDLGAYTRLRIITDDELARLRFWLTLTKH